jgi:hypothetical protein
MHTEDFRAGDGVEDDPHTDGSLTAQHAFHEIDDRGRDVNSVNWSYLRFGYNCIVAAVVPDANAST